MKSRNAFLKSLPIIVQFLGEKFGVKVRVQGSQAYTNGKIINIPALPEDDGEARILAEGFVDHECAHVAKTNWKDWQQITRKGQLHAMIGNIFEDVTIEKWQGARYPGCRRHLDRLVTTLVNNGTFPPPRAEDGAGQVLFAKLLYGQRYHVLGQKALAEYAEQADELARETFGAELMDKLDRMLDRVPHLTSTRAAGQLAEDVIQLFKDEKEKLENASEQNPMQGPESEDQDQEEPGDNQESDQGQDGNTSSQSGNDSSDDDDGDDQDGDDQGESGSGSDGSDEEDTDEDADSQDGDAGPSDGGQQETDSDQEPSGANTQQGGQDGGLSELLSGQSEIPDSDLGDIVGEQLEKKASSQHSCDQSPNLTMPAEIRQPFGTVLDWAFVRSHSSRLQARLAGLVQAKTLSRNQPREIGNRLDNRVLHRARQGDPRIFRGRTERKKVNTAVQILLDQSGSMAQGKRMWTATKASMAICQALERIPGAKPALAGFGDDLVVPIIRFGQSVRKAQVVPYADYGTTIGAACLWGAKELMAEPGVDRRILLVLTDGMTAPQDIRTLQWANDVLPKSGIELIGLGIQIEVSRAFPTSESVFDMAKLPETMFRLLEPRLVSAA